MDYIYTLIEIKKHKANIQNLSNKLINTVDINEEISVNNEIKKETELLLSLLNIKKNELLQNNNMNFPSLIFNCNIMNQNQFGQQMIQQQMLQQQSLQQQLIQIQMEKN